MSEKQKDCFAIHYLSSKCLTCNNIMKCRDYRYEKLIDSLEEREL